MEGRGVGALLASVDGLRREDFNPSKQLKYPSNSCIYVLALILDHLELRPAYNMNS